MDETESQIAKIDLGNSKSSSTYVYTMAEKAPVGSSELYVVAELPLFNPAAEEACERICLAIGSTLKRAYRALPHNESTFENSIAQINDELGKLAGLGQTDWIYKLNCVLAAKEGSDFHIASCGKVSAYLLRGGEFTDISCSPDSSHPLKTFENYASGKLRLGDLLLLSTTQLFNFLSMDRILNILENNSFLTATQTIIQLLKDGGDTRTSFGVLLNLQVLPGQVPEESVDLENYAVEETKPEPIFNKALTYIKSIFAIDKSAARKPKVDLPKVGFQDKLKNFTGNSKEFFNKTRTVWQMASGSAKTIAGNVNKEKFNSLNPIKKFFFVSLLILLLAVIGSIVVAVKVSKNKQVAAEISGQLNKAQGLLDSAQSSLLYKEYNAAGGYLAQAKALLPAANKVPAGNKTQYDKLVSELNSDNQQMEKQISVEVTNLGTLGQADRLIHLPGFIAVQALTSIISYNTQTSAIQDGQLKAGQNIFASVYTSGNNAAVFSGDNLYLWDFSAGQLTAPFSQDVPAKNDFAGMAFYPTNSRVYMVDKKNARIVNFLNTAKGFNKPIVALNDPGLANAQDMAIDGAIYVLTNSGVSKFQSGKLAAFTFPQLPTPYSGKGKIYTDKAAKNVYVLDAGNNRIIVLDKTGNLIYTMKSAQFTKLTDLAVNEAAKTMYLLNDGSLLKISLP